MTVYAFLNQKGGVGKTTLALNFCAELTRSGRRVLAIDADPQASALAWSSVRDADPLFPVIGGAKPTLHREIGTLASDYADVVIDGPPRAAAIARSIIASADVVVVPVQPSPYDVWAAADTIDLVRDARMHRPQLRSVIVINRKIANTVLGRDVRGPLAELDVPVCAAEITQRVAFAESAATGCVVRETGDAKATAEIQALSRALRSRMNGAEESGDKATP